MSLSFDKKYYTDLNALRKLDTKELEKLVQKHPYFQTAHILLAKHYYEKENSLYEPYLKKAASYAVDRSRLYEIVHEWQEAIQEEENNDETKIEENIVSTAAPIKQESIAEYKEEIHQEPLKKEDSKNTEELKEELPIQVQNQVDDASYSEIPSSTNDKEEQSPSEPLSDVAENEPDLVETHTGQKMSFLAWIKQYNEGNLEYSSNYKKELEDNQPSATSQVTNSNLSSAENLVQYKTEEPEKPIDNQEHDDTIEDLINLSQEALSIDQAKESKEEALSIELTNTTPLKSFVEKTQPSSNDLINDFIELDRTSTIKPKISPEDNSKNKSINPKKSTREFGLVSETLAIINAKQGKLEKAIEIYQQLILQDPKKSAYFVTQIEKLQNLL